MASSPTQAASGWDHPPSIASPTTLDEYDDNFGSWTPRSLHWKTSQRLFTLGGPSEKSKPRQDQLPQPQDLIAGDLFCAPIIVYNKFVLVATGGSLSVYGNFDKQDSHDESMQRRIDTTTIAPLTKFPLFSDATTDESSSSFSVRDKICKISFHDESSIIYVMTVQSNFFQVKLIIDDRESTMKQTKGSQNKDNPSDDARENFGLPVVNTNPVTTQPPTFYMIHTWVAKRFGATCMATLHEGGGFGIDTVCVGYKSGHIEAWNVYRIRSRDPNYMPQRRGRDKSDFRCSLDWEGFLHGSIFTLSFLPRCNASETEGTENSVKDDKENKGQAQRHFLTAIVLISTMIGDKGKNQPTSSMLKILDLKRIVNEVRTKSRSEASLEKYSLLQTRKMELVDASTVSRLKGCSLPKRVPILHSHGADAAYSLKSPAGSIGEEPPCTGIGLPDGTTCLISSISENRYEFIGIAEPNHQVLLSYPAIGNGQVNFVGKNGESSNYLATCLRGGTCYLIPISSNGNNNSIIAIPFPHDLASDLSDVYIQAFTAGNLFVEEKNLPILAFSWPGGYIDVYTCELMDSIVSNSDQSETIVGDSSDDFVSRAERRCLQDLIDNDSISLILNIFEEFRESSKHLLLQNEEWRQLYTDFKTGKMLPASMEYITLGRLCSIEYQNLRRVLLSLALLNE